MRGARQHHRGLLVAAALLATPAPRPLARQAAALPRLLPVRAQRTPPRQSPARSPRRRLGRMTQPHHPGTQQEPSRFLANGLVCCDDVMAPFAREILAWLAETGAPIPLILDQTKASDRHQILMLSVRWGERALPLAWRVAETEGAIGFATQQELLEVVAGWLSAGQAVILLADRFYGTPEMICWCGDRGWDYRLRLKGNLVARLGTTRTTTGALALSGGHYFE